MRSSATFARSGPTRVEAGEPIRRPDCPVTGRKAPGAPQGRYSLDRPERVCRASDVGSGRPTRSRGSGVAMASKSGLDVPIRTLRGCRLVTTSLTARVLLANQLRALKDVDWTVISGDAYDDPPEGVDVKVIPIRREFAFGDVASF